MNEGFSVVREIICLTVLSSFRRVRLSKNKNHVQVQILKYSKVIHSTAIHSV